MKELLLIYYRFNLILQCVHKTYHLQTENFFTEEEVLREGYNVTHYWMRYVHGQSKATVKSRVDRVGREDVQLLEFESLQSALLGIVYFVLAVL